MRVYQCRYCGRIGHNYMKAVGELWQCSKGNACAARSLARMWAEQLQERLAVLEADEATP